MVNVGDKVVSPKGDVGIVEKKFSIDHLLDCYQGTDPTFLKVIKEDGSFFTIKEDDCKKTKSDFEEAIDELGRTSWTAACVLGKDTDWVLENDISHMENCPLVAYYRDLAKAATKVKMEWAKLKKRKCNERNKDSW